LNKAQWKCTAEYGEECCSLHDCRITSAVLEGRMLKLFFEGGIILLPGTRANESADTASRSTCAAVEIDLYDDLQRIPEPAEAEIKGCMYLFGRYIGEHSRYISLQEWIHDINANPGKYETLYVYASEADHWSMLIQGAVHDEWKRCIFRKSDMNFELLVFKKLGTKMRFYWNELDESAPV